MTFIYNKRAGPQRALLFCGLSDSGLDCVRIDYISYAERFYVERGLGEKVLKTLGFVPSVAGTWARLGTAREG
jgi:hypothetical protein